ncbi:MAG: Coenzyme F420 hydrogenase/dehydrogenase, beta subunit C-terminal domain, partial [Clostridia bacterium]|nr:Coenzyme F420 hydrogenase/dehydrogenase, beta subunit C-terminal domain [Clostridia bacterium]
FKRDNKTDTELASKNLYMLLFLKDVILRQSCYNCAFKQKYRNSDITLADYWGVENDHLQFSDDKGTSLVVLNSKKGKDVFNEINKNFIYEQTDLDKAIKYNSCMVKSVNVNKNREDFFKRLDKCDVEKLAKKYTQKSKIKSFINRLKNYVKRMIKGVNK